MHLETAVLIFDILRMFVAAALAHYSTVSTPYLGRTQDILDDSGLCFLAPYVLES